jgi:uncharacterized protein DUF1996
MVIPGKVNGAHHIHDYVGNLSTGAYSTAESLVATDATSTNGNRSNYFWPVLRNAAAKGTDDTGDAGLDGNIGDILRPASVQLQFRGSPAEQVTAMSDNLVITTGEPRQRLTAGYTRRGQAPVLRTAPPPSTRCIAGHQLVRILGFPSCGDAKNLDSADQHVVSTKES